MDKPSAPGPLTLLLVEDAAVDAELVADELTRAGMQFELRRVDDEAGFRAALEEQPFDAILSDWTLPRFSGRAALLIARERQPDVPFLLVAGTLPLASARDALLQGAVDYVFKHQMTLLPIALTRAVKEAERRREVLRRSRRTDAGLQMSQMVDELPEAAFLTASLDLIESFTGSKMSMMLVLDSDEETIAFLACSTLTHAGREAVDVHFPVSRAGIWADAARSRRPTIVNDYPAHAHENALPHGHLRLERLLCVPVVAGGRVRAVAGVANKSADYDSFDVETLELLGGHLWRLVQRKRDEHAVRAAMERLQQANNQRRATQDQLVHAAKVSALGQLAAGLAHELDNPLAYVNSNLDSLRAYTHSLLAIVEAYRNGDDAQAIEQREDLDFIKSDAETLIAQSIKGVERARRLVLHLKGFSRRESASDWQNADVNQELDSAVNLVWSDLKCKCVLQKDYGELPLIRCLPNRVGQVLVNLLVNAGQAIADKGEITLRTTHVDGEVRIEVADTGCGIAPENLRRIFEPFYTTKPKGVGTGLGLALSANIATQHGGRLEVESEVDRGSTFRLVLPVAPVAIPVGEPA